MRWELWVLVVACGLSLGLFVRNNAVFRYRVQVLERVHQAAQIDIAREQSWEWRYVMMASVGYARMLILFWKPLPSFYPDQTFMEVTQ